MFKTKLIFAFIVLTSVLKAQTKNEFFDRKFWKTNPNIETVEQKITEGNNPTTLNPYGFDAVVYAILEKTSNKVIKHLLSKKGNDVNKLTHDKRTYIFWAAYANNVELMKHLIAQKARMDLKDSHNFSVLTFAAATGNKNKEVYELCIKNGIDIKTDVDEHGANALLLLLPHLKDLSLLDYFISKGISISSTDNDGNGAFNYVAKNGNKKMLDILIKRGLPYKNRNKNNGNAMLLATQGSRKGYNSLSFFKYLEKLEIQANVTNKQGKTPLHNLAYGNKDIETFSYFLNKGVNVNQEDKNGNTPLINAAGRNSLEIVALLAKNTKSINHKNKKGNSALSMAIQRNSLEVVEYLINNKADVLVKDTKGNSLAYYLVKSYNTKDPKIFKNKMNILIKNGVNLKEQQQNNSSLFHIALSKNNIDLLKEINKLKIDVNAKNSEGLTVLHKAVMQAKNTKIINYLLSIHANKAITTDFGETVYDLAKENEVLTSKNVDLNFLK